MYFDIPASDTARAISFYSKLFGWNFVRRDEARDYWTIIRASPDGAEVIGGLAPRIGFYPGGMIFLRKHHIPGVGWRALAKDSEGNVLGLIQHEPKH